MSIEHPSSTNAETQAIAPLSSYESITGFHLRQQFRELFFGDGSWKMRIVNFLTRSYSNYHIRERFIGGIRSQALSVAGALEPFVLEVNSTEEKVSGELTEEEVCEALKGMKLHVAITPDGARRAEELIKMHEVEIKLGLGHRQGAKIIREIFLPLAVRIPSIEEVSIFVLANANLKRRQEELDILDSLFEDEFEKLLQLARKNNIRYCHAGVLDDPEFSEKLPIVANGIQDLVDKTASNAVDGEGLVVNLCINYDAELELAYALGRVLEEMTPDQIKGMTHRKRAEAIANRSWVTRPVDLAIRTGVKEASRGVSYSSGFLDSLPVHSEVRRVSFSTLFPFLTKQHLLRALMLFANEAQRKGK